MPYEPRETYWRSLRRSLAENWQLALMGGLLAALVAFLVIAQVWHWLHKLMAE
jgi:hypothetical protein